MLRHTLRVGAWLLGSLCGGSLCGLACSSSDTPSTPAAGAAANTGTHAGAGHSGNTSAGSSSPSVPAAQGGAGATTPSAGRAGMAGSAGASPRADAAVDAAVSDAATDTPSDAGIPDAGERDASVPSDAGSATPRNRSLACPAAVSYPNPLPDEARAQRIGDDRFGFVEGPVWIAEQGVLLFSDIDLGTSDDPNGPRTRIRRLTPPDSFDVLVERAGSNGLALANDGRVLAASHDVQSLSHFDPETGERELRELSYQGKAFNAPNDLAVRSDGTIYFTDPDWQLGPRESETGWRGVYAVSPEGEVTLIDDTLNQPNGIALSPDERTLYIGSDAPEIIAFTVAADGGVSNRRVFATAAASDGLGIDCAGNLYVTAGTVQVFDPSGRKLGDISLAEDPKNVAFGGPEQKTLYITAETGVYAIDLAVPGRCY